MKRWFVAYYHNVVWDLPRMQKRSWHGMIAWVFLFPWYSLLKLLARGGFLDTPEGMYVRLRDFTPFFWRVLLERECRRYDRLLELERYTNANRIEEVRRETRDEVLNWFEDQLTEGR